VVYNRSGAYPYVLQSQKGIILIQIRKQEISVIVTNLAHSWKKTPRLNYKHESLVLFAEIIDLYP